MCVLEGKGAWSRGSLGVSEREAESNSCEVERKLRGGEEATDKYFCLFSGGSDGRVLGDAVSIRILHTEE